MIWVLVSWSHAKLSYVLISVFSIDDLYQCFGRSVEFGVVILCAEDCCATQAIVGVIGGCHRCSIRCKMSGIHDRH
jgi:hypothetical protein